MSIACTRCLITEITSLLFRFGQNLGHLRPYVVNSAVHTFRWYTTYEVICCDALVSCVDQSGRISVVPCLRYPAFMVPIFQLVLRASFRLLIFTCNAYSIFALRAGAMYVISSPISIDGNTTFIYNRAVEDGGEDSNSICYSLLNSRRTVSMGCFHCNTCCAKQQTAARNNSGC